MDSDRTLQSEFRHALDEVVPPAPWLEAAVTEDFRKRLPSRSVDRGLSKARQRRIALPRAPLHLVWMRPGLRLAATLMAVIVAVAATAAFLAVHRFFAPVPAHNLPFKVGAPGAGVCYASANPPAYPFPPCSVGDALFVSTKIGWLIENTTPQCSATPAPPDGARTCPEQGSVLFRTDDGGLHWRALHTWNNPDWQIGHILATPDGRELLIVGAQFDHSVDGGVTWTSHSFPDGCRAGMCTQYSLQPLVYFLNPRQGWVLSQQRTRSAGDLFHTTDSGAHWVLVAPLDVKAQLNLDLGTRLLYPISEVDRSLGGQLVFQSSSTAWLILGSAASASPAYLFRSLDGGLTWRLQTILRPPAIDSSDTTSWTLKFFNDREGVLEFGARKPPPSPTETRYVYTTSDGGDHWSTPIQVPNASYGVGLRYIDLNHWVGWPAGGGLIRTADAGQHWDVIPSSGTYGTALVAGRGLTAFEPDSYPPAPWFDFLTPTQGWAYVDYPPPGNSGVMVDGLALYETTDGGASWTPLSLPELG